MAESSCLFLHQSYIIMPVNSPHSTIKVDNKIVLEIIVQEHAEPLLNLVNANRQYLREWLPWVDNMQSVDDFKAYISRCKSLHEEGSDYGLVIRMNNEVAGRVGIHYINRQNSCGAIGYWLGEAFAGKGIITKSCEALIKHGFTVLQLNRIEIKCGTGNYKSAAIAERLHFKKEGVLRQAEFVNGKFIDLSLYSLLKEEWSNKGEMNNTVHENGGE